MNSNVELGPSDALGETKLRIIRSARDNRPALVQIKWEGEIALAARSNAPVNTIMGHSMLQINWAGNVKLPANYILLPYSESDTKNSSTCELETHREFEAYSEVTLPFSQSQIHVDRTSSIGAIATNAKISRAFASSQHNENVSHRLSRSSPKLKTASSVDEILRASPKPGPSGISPQKCKIRQTNSSILASMQTTSGERCSSTSTEHNPSCCISPQSKPPRTTPVSTPSPPLSLNTPRYSKSSEETMKVKGSIRSISCSIGKPQRSRKRSLGSELDLSSITKPSQKPDPPTVRQTLHYQMEAAQRYGHITKPIKKYMKMPNDSNH